MRRIIADLLRDGVLAPLATLGAGYLLTRAVLLPFSLVAFLQATTTTCSFAGPCAVVQWRLPLLGLTIPNLSLVAFLLTLVAAAVWFVGLGGFTDRPADEPRGPPAWRAVFAAPERWPEFRTPLRRALVYATGLFAFGWAAVALAPRL
ncbi:MAG: hypothetical protein ABEH77_05085 [Halobacteriaceae archaeon]